MREIKVKVENIKRFELEMPVTVYTELLRENSGIYGAVESISFAESILTIRIDKHININDFTKLYIKPTKVYESLVIR